jgi:hypothetical protein
MARRLVVAALASALLAASAARPAPAADWQPAEVPIKTRWAKDVSPDKALPEYPRPQMVRKDWLNLNGLWDFAIKPREEAKPDAWDGKILVPYPVESSLSGVKRMVGEKNRLWYRRTLEIPAGWAGKRVLLHFGAVDWEAVVTLNGKELGTHRGGYDGFSFDVTDALKPGAPQELVLAVWDPSDGGSQPRGKQVRKPGGIFYTPCTGIWQTAWLEPVPASSIDGLKIVPDVDGGALKLTVAAKGEADGLEVEAVALDGGAEVGRVAGKPGAELALPVKSPKLWSFDTPFLYDLKVALKKGGQAVDAVDSYFGMRKVALAKDDKGVQRLMLNEKFVFQVGPLDQGFWPEGIYTAPTDEALKFDIEVTKKLGFNCTRKHVKVEPDRWYYWCDKLGLLVWQDMPSANNKGDEARQQYEKELKALIDGRFNHPSIILWVVFNEGWGQYDTERLTQWTKQYDPSRFVNNASGWTDKKVGDVIDMHNYPGPGSPKPEEARAAVLGEFGGLGLPVPDHTWQKDKNWGYQNMAGDAALTRKYAALLRKTWLLKDDPGLCAAIYTQITDVETECNGLLTYDREVIKPDLQTAADANRGTFPPAPEARMLVPTSEKNAQMWRYALEQPEGEWQKPDYDASAWKEGKGGFGTEGTPGAIVGTEWKTNDIWLRREFTLPEGVLGDLQLRIHHDEDAQVWINGVSATKLGGFVSEYEETEMDPKARAALKPGKNVLAVRCKQTKGGQYIDVGIVELVPKK